MYNLYLLLGSGLTNMIIKTNYIEFSLVTYMYIFFYKIHSLQFYSNALSKESII